MKELNLTVREAILINNILISPLSDGLITVRDVRVFDSLLKKLQKIIPEAPKPEKELSGKEEDKEADQKLIEEYNAKLDAWMDGTANVSLVTGELLALRQKFSAYKGFRLGTEERAIILSVSSKLDV